VKLSTYFRFHMVKIGMFDSVTVAALKLVLGIL